jgi:nitrate/nitrite-specific signal transduction histidine kinase
MPGDNSSTTIAPFFSAGDDLVRRLRRRYLLVFLAVIALVVADQALIQPLLLRMNGYAPVINIASRQRMLSQKLAKAALGLQIAGDEDSRIAFRAELRDSLEAWAAAHESLQHDASDRGMAFASSPAINEARSELKLHFTALHRAFAGLASGTAIRDDKFASQVETIILREPSFLLAMDRLVAHMETLSAAKIRRVRFMALGVAGTIVALVGVLGWFVIRPATVAIRDRVDEGEQVAAQRMRRLDERLATLSFASAAEREVAEAAQDHLQGMPLDAKDCILSLRQRASKKLVRVRAFDGYGLAAEEPEADRA